MWAVAEKRVDHSSGPGRIDIADPTLYRTESPEREWKALRALGRAVRFDGDPAHWAVTTHQQVEEVYRRGSSFSSERGMHPGPPAHEPPSPRRLRLGNVCS
jgi:hypothetical protein